MKKELKEWGFILLIFGILYFTGLGKHVSAFLQRGLISAGLVDADIEVGETLDQQDYNFTLMDSSGQTIRFEEFRGHPIFLNFWATWCPPCVAEMPNINMLYDKCSDTDAQFVMISVDEDFEKAKSFVKRKGYKFPIYRLTSKRPTVFRSESIPTTFIISPDDQIMLKHTGLANYNTDWILDLLTSDEDSTNTDK